MKKILAIFSLVCFVAVYVSIAKDPQSTPAAKSEVVVKADAKEATPACCKGKSAKECSHEMSGYTPEQKAACMKSCSGQKAKAEAGTEKKSESAKAETK